MSSCRDIWCLQPVFIYLASLLNLVSYAYCNRVKSTCNKYYVVDLYDRVNLVQLKLIFRLLDFLPFYSGQSLCRKRQDNESVDDEKSGIENTEMKMDLQPKTGAGSLRSVKKNTSHQRMGPRQQQKFINTLEQWLVKPRKDSDTPEVCQTQDDMESTDDGVFESTSAQSLDCQNAELPTEFNMDEETQLLTPQDLEEHSQVSPASQDSAGSGLIHTLSCNDGGSETEELETCSASSETSVRHKTKMTDFFSGTSSRRLLGRKGQPDKSPGKQDGEKESTSADGKHDVKWLGTPISELKRMPECGRPLPPLRNVPDQHTVMIRVWALLCFLYYSQYLRWLYQRNTQYYIGHHNVFPVSESVEVFRLSEKFVHWNDISSRGLSR